MIQRHSRSPGALLVFKVDDQRFGLPAEQVREVLPAVAITPLPGAPPLVEGVVDVRGDVAAVLDPRRLLQRESVPIRLEDRLVLVEANGRLLALRTEHTPQLEQRTDPARALPVSGLPAVAGLARLADGLVLLHDLETLLEADDAELLDAALRARRASQA